MKKILVYGILIIVLVVIFFMFNRIKNEKVSEFGQYQGYSQAVYDGYNRQSHYLELNDGTHLAYDLYLPTADGLKADTPLPTLFKFTPYLRTFTIFDEEGNFLLEEL